MAHLNPTPVLEPGQDRTMILNMGPQHPSTHGVLRVLLEIDGETVVRMMPDIGFLHTGIEKTCEAKFYQQVVPLTDRIDYLCPMTNNLCYVLAVEKLLGLEIPPKAQWMRVLLNELTRINSHLVWLGTHAMDIGALTVFLYCFREREEVLKIFEMVSGQRMMTSYFRVGGIALEPPLGFFDRVRDFAGYFPERIDEYENLLTGNPIWTMRTKGVARMTAEDAIALGASGPTLRGSGVDIDLRRDMPYSSYEKFQFKVPVSQEGDVFARYMCRVQELRESIVDCAAGAGWHAGRPDQGRCARNRAARPRKNEDADGSRSSTTSRSSPKDLRCRRARCIRQWNLRAERWAITSSAMERRSRIACTCGRRAWRICRRCRRCAKDDCWRTWWRRSEVSILCWERSKVTCGPLCTLWLSLSPQGAQGIAEEINMRFSEEFEARFAEMVPHYPTKRSALVPTLLYAQDEVGYLSDEVIAEIASRLDLTELEVRNVISYYSMLTTKPRGKFNVQVCTNISCMVRGGEEHSASLREETGRRPQADHCRRHVHAGRSGVHRSVQLGSGGAGELRFSREPDRRKDGQDSGRV